MRGTSGTLRHTKRSRYRCSLPGLAGFAGLRRTEPEVPRIGSRSSRKRLQRQSSTAARMKKENTLRAKYTPKGKMDFIHWSSGGHAFYWAGYAIWMNVSLSKRVLPPDSIEIVEWLRGDSFVNGLARGP